MLEQYNKIKSRYSDCILFFRLGDFYEAFNEDAKNLSKVLQITLTGRGKGDSRIPMAGIPHHALGNYLPKLVNAGFKVALAEQTTKPEPGKKIVERDVVKVFTPGTFDELEHLNEGASQYVASVYQTKKAEVVFALVDITTGEFKVGELSNLKDFAGFIANLNVREVIVPENIDVEFLRLLGSGIYVEKLDKDNFRLDRAAEILCRHFDTKSLDGFGISKQNEVQIPASVALRYVKENQKNELVHISKISKLNFEKNMKLGLETINNLELVGNIRETGVKLTVLDVINKCNTPMGKRTLRNWLLAPSKDQSEIEKRHDAVEYFVEAPDLLKNIREKLKDIYDLERLTSRIGSGSATPKDLIGISKSIEKMFEVLKILKNENTSPLFLNQKIDDLDLVAIKNFEEIIEGAINEDTPIKFDKGGVIKDGVNLELDELRGLLSNSKAILSKIETQERESTKIDTLKIKFNKVFGFYIEISKAKADAAPEHYVRKQTLANAERFITPELKELETKILTAEERIVEIEQEVFKEVLALLKPMLSEVLALAQIIGAVDTICNFAFVAKDRNYTRAKISPAQNTKRQGAGAPQIFAEASRHAVVEVLRGAEYIPNNINIEASKNLNILTGPNMSGKSTYIRQIAILAILNQIGSFVPAKAAILPIFDNIYTRVGASDSLATGESTFMVEMNETANILNNATANSLIILDEIGRGTSTYDGVAIAWAIVKYIHENIGAPTIFATHYHELVDLEQKYERIKNISVKVDESGDKIVFTHEILDGSTNKSYGIHVADIAGMPKSVVEDAKEILGEFEKDNSINLGKAPENTSKMIKSKPKKKIHPTKPNVGQISFV